MKKNLMLININKFFVLNKISYLKLWKIYQLKLLVSKQLKVYHFT